MYTGTCDTTKYQSVFFYMDDTWFEVTPKMFILDLGASYTANDECLIGFGAFSDTTYFLFGDVFLREYYTIHDDSGGRVGLSPNVYSTATMAVGTQPSTVLTPYQDSTDTSISPYSIDYAATYATVGAVTATFAAFGGFLYLLYIYPVV